MSRYDVAVSADGEMIWEGVEKFFAAAGLSLDKSIVGDHSEFMPPLPVKCAVFPCVYNNDRVCNEPTINAGNGDAACHEWTFGEIRKMLKPIKVYIHTDV